MDEQLKNNNGEKAEKSNINGFFKSKTFYVIMIIILVIGGLSMKNFVAIHESHKNKPEEKQLLLVKAIKARRGDVQQWLIADGTTRAVKREFLKFEYPGKVVFLGKDINGKELKEGSIVRGPKAGKKGQLLAQIDSRDYNETIKVYEATLEKAFQGVASAKAALKQAEKNFNLAKNKLARAQRLFDKEAMSEVELETNQAEFFNSEAALKTAQARLKVAEAEVKAARAQLSQAKIKFERTSIFAPFDGIISYLNIRVGDYTSPEAINVSTEHAKLQTTPIVLIDPDQYEVTLNLPSYEGKLVNVGQLAFITWGDFALPGKIDDLETANIPYAMGKVYSINPAISPTGRTIQVKIRTVANADLLQDGMYVTCWIIVKEAKNAVLAPAESVIWRKENSSVFVVDKKTGKVSKRVIKEGVSGMTEVEVLDGVKEGEWLVTEGRHRLVEGATVEIIKEKGEE